ncbi:MAG: hypothetical protein NVS3B21_19990 [Acidimicrobiales bacterium]
MKVRCSVCDLDLGGQRRTCPNFWCHRTDRGFDVVWSAGAHTGNTRRSIAALKYRGDTSAAAALAAPLAAVLLGHPGAFEDVELIAAVPGHPSPGRPVDHSGALLEALRTQVGHLWEVDDLRPAVVVKRRQVRPMTGLPSMGARRIHAAGELRDALEVPDPSRIQGRRILVVDDVLTGGSTLREVALALRRAGAAAVSGLVVARRPLRAQSDLSGPNQGVPGRNRGHAKTPW